MAEAMLGRKHPSPKREPEIDIQAEYLLIQKKQSKLSARKRQWVIRNVEK